MGYAGEVKKLLARYKVEPYLESDTAMRALFHFVYMDGRVDIELDTDDCHLTVGIDVDWPAIERDLATMDGDSQSKSTLLFESARESNRPLLKRLVQNKALIACGLPIKTAYGMEYSFAICGNSVGCLTALEEFLNHSHELGRILPSKPGTAKKRSDPAYLRKTVRERENSDVEKD